MTPVRPRLEVLLLDYTCNSPRNKFILGCMMDGCYTECVRFLAICLTINRIDIL